MYARAVSLPIMVSRMRAAVVNAMPQEAMSRGSTVSDSLPVNGEKSAIMRGWAMSTRPALWGLSPLISCR